MPGQVVTVRMGTGPMARNFPVHGSFHTPSPPTPIPEALQSFVTASFETHVFLINNILIVPLISFKLHKKYKGPDQEIVTEF